jgi:hypothetical protein
MPCSRRYGVGKWRQIQKDDALGPRLINRSNVDLKVGPLQRQICCPCTAVPCTAVHNSPMHSNPTMRRRVSKRVLMRSALRAGQVAQPQHGRFRLARRQAQLTRQGPRQAARARRRRAAARSGHRRGARPGEKGSSAGMDDLHIWHGAGCSSKRASVGACLSARDSRYG